MNLAQLITATLLAVSMLGIANATAGERNPLHPTYNWDKTRVPAVVRTADSLIAAPITNPLHPGYHAARVVGAPFVAAGALRTSRHVDARNPLHPSFHR